MPEWRVHDKWASRLGIDRRLSREVNSEIDSIDDPRFHDYGRVIVLGRWDFSYLYPVLKSFYSRWRREEAVKAFLLHHILDYMATLLHSPSVFPNVAVRFVDGLIEGIKSDAVSQLEGELREIVLKSCDEIRKLLKDNIVEVISDIRPEYTNWFKWAEKRLLKLYCEKCGRQFTTIDFEARDFFARRGVGIPESFVKLCIKCRELSLSKWLEEELKKPYSGFSRYMLHPSLQDDYWKEIVGKAEALIAMLRFEELKETELF